MACFLSVVGIDIAKRVFHLVGMDDRGNIILRKRLARGEVLSFMANLPPVIVGMEACGGTHEWARQLREQGHDVKLMAPQSAILGDQIFRQHPLGVGACASRV